MFVNVTLLMPLYSHSRLGAYENCPFQYKLRYVDKVKPILGNTIESFMGSMVHDALEWLYKLARDSNIISKEALVSKYDELWIGKWTDDYKKFLDSLLPETNESKSKKKETKKKKEKKTILDYTNNCSDTEIDFTIHLPVGMINSLQWSEDPNIDGIEKFFKLTTTKGLSLTNMHLYNNKGQIVKYNSLNDIYDEFYEERYALYVKRKEYILSNLSNDLLILESKIRFIHDVINEQIIIYKQKKDIILQSLIDKKYLQVKDKVALPEDSKYLPSNYDYLVKMSLYAFTEEEITKLESEMKKLQDQYSELDQKTIEEIWSDECDALKKAL